jgi:glycogen(starch) synthase
MHILRIVYDFPPPWSGLAPGPYELSKAQVSLGNKVTVWAGGWNNNRNEVSEDGLIVKRLGSRVKDFGIFPFYAPSSILRYLLYRDKLNIDIVHGHNFHPAGFNLLHWLGINRIPFVIHMHMNAAQRMHTHWENVSRMTRMLEWKFSIWAERLSCTLADAIICVSQSVFDQTIHWYGVETSNAYIVSNGVNTTRFCQGGPSVRDMLGLANRKVLLFVGRLNSNKNVVKLIEALRYLPDEYFLLIVGSGEDFDRCRIRADELNLTERLRMVGSIDYRTLPTFYRSSDVLCIASDLEGMPKVVLEALASGVPVVASRSFQPSKDLVDEITWLESNTAECIASAVRSVVESGIKPNAEYIREKFDWTVIASKIGLIYESLINI